MARLPRLAVPGQPHLVIQHGLDGKPMFIDDADRRFFVDAMASAARSCAVAVHAYGLTDHGINLLVTPQDGQSLGKFMQRLGRRYVLEFHRRHGTSGALWNGRFHSAAIDPEHYLLHAMQLIEQAATRAGAATSALDWPWSSARHHTGRERVAWISEHPHYWRLGNTPFEREAKHETALEKTLDQARLEELLRAARGGWPLGRATFIEAAAKGSSRSGPPRPRGRPRRLAESG